jgi:hypothetical protein
MMEGGSNKEGLRPGGAHYSLDQIAQVSGAGIMPVSAEITAPGGGSYDEADAGAPVETAADSTAETSPVADTSQQAPVEVSATIHDTDAEFVTAPVHEQLNTVLDARRELLDISQTVTRDSTPRREQTLAFRDYARGRLVDEVTIASEQRGHVDLGDRTELAVQELTEHLLHVSDKDLGFDTDPVATMERIARAVQAVHPADSEVTAASRIASASMERRAAKGSAHYQESVVGVLHKVFGVSYRDARNMVRGQKIDPTDGLPTN